jgi:5'-nucleotidase
VADRLKSTEKCDMIICLSHLGDVYNDNKVSDAILAAETYDVDLIIGGHTHRFFEAPRIYKNRRNTEVAVNQVGWAGINLGRLDYRFSGNRKKNLVNAKTIVIGEKKDN